MSNGEPASQGLLKVSSVARLLDCSTKTVYRMVEKGDLASIDFGDGHIRIERSEFARYLGSLKKRKR